MGNRCCTGRGQHEPVRQPPSVIQFTDVNGTDEEKVNGDLTSDAVEYESPVILRALYTYDAQNPDDLSFRKDDKMYLIGDSENCDWWLARHIVTKEAGYIPSNYVQKEDGKPHSHVSWFDLRRPESDKLLLMPGNPPGTYITRPSSHANSYALSVRDYSERSQMWRTKHYRIRPMDDGRGFYITPNKRFHTYDALIDFYRENEGLCQKLVLPCPRVYKPPCHFREMIQSKAAFTFVSKLGSGHFGDVYAGKWNNSVAVAIKTMRAGNTSSKESFIGEARIMHQLYHPHILPLLGVCIEDESIYIVTELMSKGALLDVLRSEEGRTLTLETIVDMAFQIADGLSFLERKNMVHRDIRAANILVGENYLCKIADFGLAQFKYDGNNLSTTTSKFPIKWTAPEATEDKTKFTVKSDVWSFGILLWEMLTLGKMPYPGMDPSTTLTEVKNGYRMPKPTSMYGNLDCPDALYDLMLKCWSRDPEARPTFDHLGKFFDDFATEAAADYNNTDT